MGEVQGQEKVDTAKQMAMIKGDPTFDVVTVDGATCVQVELLFDACPFATFGIDSRMLKMATANFSWAHSIAEILALEEVDILELEGIALSAQAQLDRQFLSWLAQN